MSKKKIKCIYCKIKNKQKRYHKQKGCKKCGMPLHLPSRAGFHRADKGTVSRIGFHRVSAGKEGRYNADTSRNKMILSVPPAIM